MLLSIFTFMTLNLEGEDFVLKERQFFTNTWVSKFYSTIILCSLNFSAVLHNLSRLFLGHFCQIKAFEEIDLIILRQPSLFSDFHEI